LSAKFIDIEKEKKLFWNKQHFDKFVKVVRIGTGVGEVGAGHLKKLFFAY
jgi:hypothetical protein